MTGMTDFVQEPDYGQAAVPARPAGGLGESAPETNVWITTDAAGFVLACSSPALDLLGYSRRGARGRELTNMFVGERPHLSELLRAARGDVIEREAIFRPNDRKSLRVRFRLEPGEPLPDGGLTLRWTFDVRWQVGMRLPNGLDRRQLITVWRSDGLCCHFAPGGPGHRRLFVCSDDGEVLHEEAAGDPSAAFTRAGALLQQAGEGAFRRT
jgi:hypothetical protein